MLSQKKVAVAMSGGIDSSTSAVLLKKAGFDVFGIYAIFQKNYDKATKQTAQRTAKILYIPFYTIDLQEEFEKEVIDYFLKSHKSGLTPNPCIICNEKIKFGILLKTAQEFGAQMLATGHYAKVQEKKDGFHLYRGSDSTKDQSYFLWRLKQKQLKHVMFPLAFFKKEEIKKIARDLKLPAVKSKESQDVCFCPDTNKFLSKLLKPKSGKIVDPKGNVLGKHNGLSFYTIGQRQGIKLSGGPYYVLSKNTKRNTLIVTKDQDDLLSKGLIAKNINWTNKSPKFPFKALAQIRYRNQPSQATIKKSGNKLKVVFAKPQKAITPGQSVVFYKNNEVLGGGIIEKTWN